MADDTPDLTVSILREIRDQLVKTTERIDALGCQQTEANELTKVLVSSHSKLNEKVDSTNARLDSTNARLDRLTEEIVRGRTNDVARLLEHDERLARIEKHLGFERH